MTAERDKTAVWLVVAVLASVAVVCLFVATWQAGREAGHSEMKVEAVKRGAAEYDATSGKWKWKD